MKPAAAKRQRCAIYTRKSTEHNLDLAFNSLDAQREAARPTSRAKPTRAGSPDPDRYDDGGFSGGTLERPALQQLLDDVRARQDRCHRRLQGRSADPLARRLRQARRTVR